MPFLTTCREAQLGQVISSKHTLQRIACSSLIINSQSRPSRVIPVGEPKAVEGSRTVSGHNKPVLIDQPDLRLIKAGYALPLLVLATGALVLLLPTTDGAKIGIGYALVMVLVSSLTFFLSSHGRLHKARYTVTDDYVEAQTGTFERTTRRIPLGYIRDVTHRQNYFQRLLGISDINVTATNGDSVMLENITDGERKREIIWDLVLAKSPGASRPRT